MVRHRQALGRTGAKLRLKISQRLESAFTSRNDCTSATNLANNGATLSFLQTSANGKGNAPDKGVPQHQENNMSNVYPFAASRSLQDWR